jgi:hypothetical protein
LGAFDAGGGNLKRPYSAQEKVIFAAWSRHAAKITQRKTFTQ